MSTHIPSHIRQPSRMQLNVIGLAERTPGSSFIDLVKEALGEQPLSKWQVLHNDVVVATYVRPRKTPGGIIIPEKSVDEDRYQGKVGLVLKLGESAFDWYPPYGHKGNGYRGPVPKPWQFITFHSSDARESSFKGFSIKYINDQLVKAIIPEEDADHIY